MTTTPTLAARAAIATTLTYQALLLLLIPLRPDLDPSWHTISEWAIGPYGWLMTSAFLISALSYGALLLAVRREVRGQLGKIGLALLLVSMIPMIGVLGFVVYTALFVVPMGEVHGPGVHIGWPPRFAFATYTIWIVTLALAYQRCVPADRYRRRRVVL